MSKLTECPIDSTKITEVYDILQISNKTEIIRNYIRTQIIDSSGWDWDVYDVFGDAFNSVMVDVPKWDTLSTEERWAIIDVMFNGLLIELSRSVQQDDTKWTSMFHGGYVGESGKTI